MPGRVIRRAEFGAIADLLTSAATAAGALVIEGEAGIGKTTQWLAGVAEARERGFTVLSARAAAEDSVLAYASIMELLNAASDDAITQLPHPQRLAIGRIRLQGEMGDSATNQRAVAAGFLSVVKALSARTPLLVAIDDLQWLDRSSMLIIGFAMRRLAGPVGVLATVRTGRDSTDPGFWLELPRPAATHRITLRPLSLGGLHALLSERLQRSFSRPTMVRIHQLSGGNPFYALELARAMDLATRGPDDKLPSTLADLIRARITNLDSGTFDALLAAACLPAPTVDVISRAIDVDPRSAVELLRDAEDNEVIQLDGHRLYFMHSLLARGVYSSAQPAQRRAMHRRLADVVEQPELRARHLALAATRDDAETLQALDAAAEMARNRGAPAAAAELVDLAIGLGGDTPMRRILSATNHFNGGDYAKARSLLEETLGGLTAGPLRAQALSLMASLQMAVGSFHDAADSLDSALENAEDNLALRVPIAVMRTYALINASRYAAGARSADDAVAAATHLGNAQLISQALGIRAVVRCLRGEGFDEIGIKRALELDNRESDISLVLRPRMHNAVLMAWTGRLEDAHQELQAIRRRCIERGEESEMMLAAVHSVQTEIWRGQFNEAMAIADDAMERAQQLGDDMALFVAHAAAAACEAYAGQVDAARRDISEALAASRRCAVADFALWVFTTSGFLELSLGNSEAAVEALEPLLCPVDMEPTGTEIFLAAFVPDAVEALIGLRRLDEAEPLIEELERNGRRLDRAWMLAVGGRCRAMLHAARGEVSAAMTAVYAAMVEHERLPMPFERARTQLVLGQLQRRHRRHDAAATTLREALDAFERMAVPLWAERARAELTRTAPPTGALTDSEQRVAELAASGMTNRRVAETLFISPKTVEATLSRVYHKLGIRSRAELGRTMRSP